VKCPRCGADNSEQASWCSLCQYAFPEKQGAAGGEAAPAPQDPQYQPQGQGYQQGGQVYPSGAETGQNAYPPAPGGYPSQAGAGFPQPGYPQPPGGGYPPPGGGYPPPGAYPPGYAPPPQKAGLSTTTRVLAAIVLLLVFAGLAIGGIYLIRNKSAEINVPMPPNFREATQVEMNAMEDSTKSNSGDMAIDNYYLAEDGDGLVIAFHQKMSLAEKPPSDPKQMQEYYDRNKDEIMRGFDVGFQQAAGSGISAEVGDYEVVTLACGESALRMTMDISVGRSSVYMEMLMLFKGNTGYGIMFEAPDDTQAEETMQFLRDNISFD
jgi:hypothetical protein